VALSTVPGVASTTTLGTVLSVELEGAAGYGGGVAADRAREVTGRLRSQGVLARPLGGVVYLLASPMTDPVACAPLQAKLDAAVRAACAGGK